MILRRVFFSLPLFRILCTKWLGIDDESCLKLPNNCFANCGRQNYRGSPLPCESLYSLDCATTFTYNNLSAHKVRPHLTVSDMTTLEVASGKAITVDEGRSRARAFSNDLFTNWHLLNAILKRHEETIYRRWAKKSKTQRTHLLLAVWPKMPATHRPDFVAYRRETDRQREAGTKFRNSYLWYVN